MSKTLAVAFTSLIEFAVMLIVLLAAGNMVLPWLPVVALLFGLQLVMVLGIGLMLSVANVYFRDIQYLLNIALQLLFYSAAIIFPISLIAAHGPGRCGSSGSTRWSACSRPTGTCSTTCAGRPLVDVGYVALWAFGILVVGMVVFRRFQGRLVEEL